MKRTLTLILSGMMIAGLAASVVAAEKPKAKKKADPVSKAEPAEKAKAPAASKKVEAKKADEKAKPKPKPKSPPKSKAAEAPKPPTPALAPPKVRLVPAPRPPIARRAPTVRQLEVRGEKPRPQPRMEEHALLGLALGDVAPVLRAHIDLPEEVGVMVTSVLKDSPAEKAGVKAYDIVTMLDDQLIVVGGIHLQKLVRMKKKGDKVRLTVVRKGQEKKIDVVLVEKAFPVTMAPGPGAHPWVAPKAQGEWHRRGAPAAGQPGKPALPKMDAEHWRGAWEKAMKGFRERIEKARELQGKKGKAGEGARPAQPKPSAKSLPPKAAQHGAADVSIEGSDSRHGAAFV